MNDLIANARNDLRVAIDRRAACEGSVRTANQAKQRAEALVKECRAKMADIDVSIKAAARRRAESIKAGVVIKSFEKTERALALAQADLAEAIDAMELLSRGYSDTQAALRASEVAVRDAAARVITLEAEVLAQELIAHRERAADLRNRLLGLSYVSKGGPANFSPWGLTPKLSAALNWAEPQLPGHVNPIKSSVADWTAYRDALAQSADAVLSPIPSSKTDSSKFAQAALAAG